MMPAEPSERAVIVCLGAVQFVTVLDGMIVMPLGPDLANALGIPHSLLAYVGGAYTAAATVSGVAGVFYLDRYDRRRALGVAMLGLVVGTLSGAFATGLGTILLARVVAGAFGGPVSSLCYSIVADVVPAERRGRAMGAVMAALSIASLLGVPVGLELARHGGWRVPLMTVAGLGVVVGIAALAVLGGMATARREHRDGARNVLRDLVGLLRADVGLALAMTFILMCTSYILVPNVPAFLLNNLHYPRERFGFLYLVGGAAGFAMTRLAGSLVDRHGAARIGTGGALAVSVVAVLGYVYSPPLIPVVAIFVGSTMASPFRNVACSTLSTMVPRPEERARFLSVQSGVTYFAATVGAFASAQFLSELPDHTLIGIDHAALASIGLSLVLVFLLWTVERRVERDASGDREHRSQE